MSAEVRVARLREGAFWRITFGAARGNIIDRDTMAALERVWHDAAADPHVKAIVIEGTGADFSFGASVQEHLPEHVQAMLTSMRQLILALLESQIIVLAAVRGRCLGGGLELASVCHRIFASADATFGQPEIALGVFAPIASIVLPERIGRAHAEDLCLTGRTVPADEAQRMGLVDEIASGDPADSALAWAERHLAGKSASSLRYAVRAIRRDLVDRIRRELPKIEAFYMSELMATPDAIEGLRAFLEKRPPRTR
jgi:cyclohexa-1,5-dienecarbonyl-CoA hydratase